MAEILLDTKFWNKVFKILRPATVVAVKKNKGTGKEKLIPSNGLVFLAYADNAKGFFYELLDIHFEQKYDKRARVIMIESELHKKGLFTPMIRDIEKAILQVAIADSLIPETATYNGEPVVQQIQENIQATSGFGFVYFVRNEDIHKIGITENLLRRMKELKPDEILNSVRCINYQEIEKKMHAHFKGKRIPQTEYFRLNAAEVEEAHALMTQMANFTER